MNQATKTQFLSQLRYLPGAILNRNNHNNKSIASFFLQNAKASTSTSPLQNEAGSQNSENPGLKPRSSSKNNNNNKTPGGISAPFDFRAVYPDFLPYPVFAWRHHIAEKLEREDMLKRRMQVDIPEFYVGSILSVSVSDDYSQTGITHFLGICIDRDQRGLRHHFTLRNTVEGMGVEVRYDMYNPLIEKIEVIKLEKRLDDNLLYLRDADPVHCTFPMDMQPIPHPPRTPVPINSTKIKLRPPPWTANWENKDLKGVEDFWDMVVPIKKYKYHKKLFQQVRELEKFDIVGDYRKSTSREDEEKIFKEMLQFEDTQPEITGRRRKYQFRKSGRSLASD